MSTMGQTREPERLDLPTPELGPIARKSGLAGQIEYSTTVTYPGEPLRVVRFIGHAYGGPVVMVSEPWGQTFVTDPARFGMFGPEWVRRFFGVTA